MEYKISFIAFALALTISAAPEAGAQWTSTKGPPGGNITAIATVGNTLFAGTTNGVFLLNPGDTMWTPAGLQNTFILSLLTSGGNLIAGTNSGVFLANGPDTSWAQSNEIDYVYALASNGTNLFAGTNNGVLISNDNGNSWTVTNYAYNAYALASAGSNLFVANYDGGVSVSPDNGNTWTESDNGLPFDDVKAFAVSGSGLFAGLHYAPGGVFLSNDNGNNWTSVSAGLPDTVQVNALCISGGYLFAGADSGVFVSTDNGSSWRDVSDGLNDSSDYVPANIFSFAVSGNNLYAGTQRGVWMSPIQLFADVGMGEEAKSSIVCFPNPFSNKTTITFSLPEGGMAEIAVVNLLGSEVARLYDGELDAGEHSFEWEGRGMTPGMYECILHINGNMLRAPMILVRN